MTVHYEASGDAPALRWRKTYAESLQRLFANGLVSYALVAGVQLRVIWNIWHYRDLTYGDTSSYFNDAIRWASELKVQFIWSPLYTAFYGTVHALFDDAYDATILHRVIIVMLATIGVLAVARKMLPAPLALLLAVWWAVLPVNFDVMYEVHLFALLPILAAWLIAMRSNSAGSRGAALSLLVLTAVLVRNELSIACVVYGLYCVWLEAKDARLSGRDRRQEIRLLARHYLLPLALSLLVCGFFYGRNPYSFATTMAALEAKTGLNMCQVYASGYAQRHPEWTLSPWTDCGGLMTATFGVAWPTLGHMLVSNSRAVLQHFLWNIGLTGNGIQVALFNATSGTINPDYGPVDLGESYPDWLSGLVFLVLLAAMVALCTSWRTTWWGRFRARGDRWVILLAVAAVAVPVILTQRPRPEYLYALTLVLMIIIATGVDILTHRWPLLVGTAAGMIALATLVLVPAFYPTHTVGRPLRTGYERLRPYEALLKSQPGPLLLGDYAFQLASYLGLLAVKPVEFLDYAALGTWNGSGNLCAALDCRKIPVIFIQPRLMGTWNAQQHNGGCPVDPDGRPWMAVGTAAENADGLLLIRQDAMGPFATEVPSVACKDLRIG